MLLANTAHLSPTRTKVYKARLWLLKQKYILLHQKSKYCLLLVFSLTVFVFTVFFFENSCLTPYNMPIGIPLPYQQVDLSTRLTRSLNQHKKCPLGKPCHVYPTLPADANTQVILNVHTHEDIPLVLVQMAPKDHYAAT